jgi:hypothetical protein
MQRANRASSESVNPDAGTIIFLSTSDCVWQKHIGFGSFRVLKVPQILQPMEGAEPSLRNLCGVREASEMHPQCPFANIEKASRVPLHFPAVQPHDDITLAEPQWKLESHHRWLSPGEVVNSYSSIQHNHWSRQIRKRSANCWFARGRVWLRVQQHSL